MTDDEIGPVLKFTTHDGADWKVREFSALDDARNLIFECDSAMRRVRNFPPDWRELDREALVALSWKT